MNPPDRHSVVASAATFASFDALIDVRSPAEFAEDHVPGALLCPVLDGKNYNKGGDQKKMVDCKFTELLYVHGNFNHIAWRQVVRGASYSVDELRQGMLPTGRASDPGSRILPASY